MAESTLAVLRIHAHGDERTHFAELHGILSGVRAPNGRAYDLPHTMAVMFVRAEAEWRIRSLTPVANPRS
jgi:hypothetical protein